MEDLIKREDAERYIYSLIPIKQDADEIVKAIKVIPSADRPSIDEQAEEILNQIYDAVNGINALLDRPQGENLSEEYPSLFECSVCGASCFDTIPWDCNINFCPNCGARMVSK